MSHSTQVGFRLPPLVASRKFRQACPRAIIDGAPWLAWVVGVANRTVSDSPRLLELFPYLALMLPVCVR